MQVRQLTLLLGALLISGIVNSSSDRLLSSWKDPAVKKLDFQRIVAVAMVSDGPTRRLAESEMVNIMGPKAVAASQVVPEADLEDADKVRVKLSAEGFDGAVTIRLVDATTKVRTARDPVPTSYYSMWGYYQFAWVADRPPDYYTADQKLQIEVNIYSLTSGKLVWSGTSEIVRPQLVETGVRNVADLVRRRLKREHLIP
jgi:hypothetical protein